MGLFDLPSPLYSTIDNLLGFLPPLPRLLIWAVFSGGVSMLFYWLCSRQDKVAAARDRALRARADLNAYEGHEFGEMWPLAAESLKASLAHFGVVLGPALLGSLPALTLIVWVSNNFGYSLPKPGEPLAMLPQPAITLNQQSLWDSAFVARYPADDTAAEIRTADGELLLTLPLAAPVPIVHKKLWWNSLIGNGAGYLDDDAAVDEIRFWLQRQTFLNVGPAWMRGWELTYFFLLVVSSLVIKRVFRIA